MDLYYLLFDWLRDCFVFGKEKGNRVIINFLNCNFSKGIWTLSRNRHCCERRYEIRTESAFLVNSSGISSFIVKNLNWKKPFRSQIAIGR